MARKFTYVKGTIRGAWVIQDVRRDRSNTHYLVKCRSCGHQKHLWSNALKSHWEACPNCVSVVPPIGLAAGTVLLQAGDYITIYLHKGLLPNPLPEGSSVYIFTGSSRALRLESRSSEAPPPNPGYNSHLVIPAKWAAFFMGDGDLATEAESTAAMAWWDEHVEEGPEPSLSLGNHVQWLQNDETFQYLYWRDSNSPPKALGSTPAPFSSPDPTLPPPADENGS